MQRIYIGQTDLSIVVRVNQNIAGATITRIAYIAPSGTRATWNASIQDAANGVIAYSAVNNEFNQVGAWTLWADITLSTGLRAIGSPSIVNVVNAGNA
jgi:hypothetical protein